MSSPNQARRVTAHDIFPGRGHHRSMRPYFLSATYTDKEADGTDDLQLKLQDRVIYGSKSGWPMPSTQQPPQGACPRPPRPRPMARQSPTRSPPKAA